ncbi:MAG TPA: elongation factor P [Anaerolineales bacterium]|nr:elongation factor P [Anaerolineales bacterium]
MIDVNDLRKGVTFELDNTLYKVLDYEHHKPGRGKATIRVRARNLRTGTILDKSFISGDRVQDVRLDYHNVQYLYTDGELFYFMDLETYDQPAIPKEIVGEASEYLKESLEVKLTFFQSEPLDIELPITVDLAVINAETAVRGDTATGVTKKVVTETGLEVQVPNFVNIGDTIRVDTRSGSYVTRA